MDQIKVGKFICDCRNRKKITQEELANRLNITYQSVSKWERGINFPDAAILSDLCSYLDITVEELLKGEFNDKNNNIDNDSIIDGINIYQNITKKKYFKIIFALVFMFILLISSFLFIYYVNNYNKIKIYNLYTSSDNLLVNGRIVFNPKNNIIMISDIQYNDEYVGTNLEKKVKSFILKIEIDDKVIFECGNEDSGQLFTLNDILNNTRINSLSVHNEFEIKESDLNDVYVYIYYIDDNDEENIISEKLKFDKEFSNSSFLYN